jgi:hypothetical protein
MGGRDLVGGLCRPRHPHSASKREELLLNATGSSRGFYGRGYMRRFPFTRPNCGCCMQRPFTEAASSAAEFPWTLIADGCGPFLTLDCGPWPHGVPCGSLVFFVSARRKAAIRSLFPRSDHRTAACDGNRLPMSSGTWRWCTGGRPPGRAGRGNTSCRFRAPGAPA